MAWYHWFWFKLSANAPLRYSGFLIAEPCALTITLIQITRVPRCTGVRIGSQVALPGFDLPPLFVHEDDDKLFWLLNSLKKYGRDRIFESFKDELIIVKVMYWTPTSMNRSMSPWSSLRCSLWTKKRMVRIRIITCLSWRDNGDSFTTLRWPAIFKRNIMEVRRRWLFPHDRCADKLG